MTHKSKRYLFIDFEDLQKVKFKKLEKVCNKIFIFISENVKLIPFELALQIQKFGKHAKWIPVAEHLEEDMSFHICFTMGKMHEKVRKDVEFAVLSNETIYDSIVNFINEENRVCLRVKSHEEVIATEEISEEIINGSLEIDDNSILKDIIIEDILDQEEEPEVEEPIFVEKKTAINGKSETSEVESIVAEPNEEETALIEKTAEDTVRLLVHSGNRPSDISMLRSYILIHNKDLSYQGDLDKIIDYLVSKKDIVLNKDEVTYNF